MADPDTFTAWARQAVPTLYSRARLLTGDAQTAEDLVQDTLTRMYLAWDRVDAARNPDGYAMRSLYHQFVSLRRRRSSTEWVTDDLPELLHPQVDNASRIDLTRALASLKPLERALIVARYIDDLPVAACAELLGRTEGWVKVTSARTLQKLRLAPELAPTPT